MKNKFIEIESTHFTQTDGYGCGLYAVANMLKEESFITETRLEISKKRMSVEQLNKFLLIDDKDMHLAPIYFNMLGGTIPSKIIKTLEIKSSDPEYKLFIPIFISFDKTKNSKSHFVYASIDEFGNILVYDSLNKKAIFADINSYLKSLHKVYGIWVPFSYSTSEMYFIETKIETN